MSTLRGIYSAEEEQLETFRKGVPVFDTVKESLEWAEKHAQCGSNPEDPRLKHTFTTLVGWTQVEKYLIPKLSELQPSQMADLNASGKPAESAGEDKCVGDEQEAMSKPSNAVEGVPELTPLVDEVDKRLSLPFHATVNRFSSINTLKYMYYHMRCGVAVVIKNNKVHLFAPFVNDQYRNNWGHKLRTDPSPLDTYYNLKRGYYRPERIIQDPRRWWANGNILCNEHYSPKEAFSHWWGDNLLVPFKHMLESLCNERIVPDVQIFFNKRDHPQLKANLTEPYDFLFDEHDVLLPDDKNSLFKDYAPILSFYCSERFADLPVPTTEDWEAAVGKVFPPSFIPNNHTGKLESPRDMYLATNFKKFFKPWEQKVDVCFFRGNGTGGGTLPSNNQRLHLAQLNKQWASDPDKQDLLDAGVTGFNARDKKLFGEPMRFPRAKDMGISKAPYVEMYKQGEFKYILYVEGHCAANRYGFLMRLGSVVFKVASTCEASEMWFFPLLKPMDCVSGATDADGADHIPIKADLSDLFEKIMWCKQHDEVCKQVATNAGEKYERLLGREALLNYMQFLFIKVARNFEHPPAWWTPPLGHMALQPRPRMEPPATKCAKVAGSYEYEHCKRCRLDFKDAHNCHMNS